MIAAGIMYVTPEGKALWLRQAGGKGFEPEWVFPGGKVEKDETARQAAVREANEELGTAPLGTPLLLHQDVTARGVDYSTFLQVVPTEFIPQLSGEHSAYAWAPLDSPPGPPHPGIVAMLQKVGGWVDKALDEAKAEDKAEDKVDGTKATDTHDANPEGSEQIALTIIDPDKQLVGLLEHIKSTAAVGHSFNVVVDPGNKDYEKKFGIDGDGAFRIVDVKVGGKAEDEASLAANAALPVGKKAEDCAPARDAMAQDRTLDDDGRLHVQSSHITRACVSEYWGREIPNFKGFGLQPDVKYRLLRPAEELSKPETVASLNNIPLLDKHVPVSADDHQPDRVIGSTGTDATWNAPFLDNSLVIWAKSAIEQVERGDKSDLSAGYRYQYVPEPGTFEGEAYDGKMINIRFNHVAHVLAGRTPGAMVGDETLREDKDMAAIELKQWDRLFGAMDAQYSPTGGPRTDRRNPGNDPSKYKATGIKSQFGGYRAEVIGPHGGASYTGAEKFDTEAKAKAAAQKYIDTKIATGNYDAKDAFESEDAKDASTLYSGNDRETVVRMLKAKGWSQVNSSTDLWHREGKRVRITREGSVYQAIALDAMLPDDDRAFKKIADAITGAKDAYYGESFTRDLQTFINSLGLPNASAVFDYVSNRRSFDPLVLEDKFGVKFGASRRIQDEMKRLRVLHGEGVGSINKPVDNGKKIDKYLSQKWPKR